MDAGDPLEVGGQLHPILPGDLGDQAVQLRLGLARFGVRGCVPVVDGDEGQAHGAADPAEQRDVPLATALDDRDPLPVGVVSQRFEHEGQRELLGEPLDQHGGACQEELAPGGVELGEGAELFVRRERLRLQQERPDLRPAFGEHELVQTHDVEERGGVRGVEDLIAAGRDEPEQPVQVALGLRREEQLGFLHQDDDTGDARLLPGLEAGDQSVRGSRGTGRGPAVRRRAIDGCADDRFDRMVLRPRAGRSDDLPIPEVGGEEERRGPCRSVR